MNERHIYITAKDYQRINELLAAPEMFSARDRADLQALRAELARAKVVDSLEIPKTVVTMNTQLRFIDLDDGTQSEVTLTFPSDANIDRGKLSVLSPIGTALLGYSKGDEIEWSVPAGTRRIRIEEVLYQPEAAGDLHL